MCRRVKQCTQKQINYTADHCTWLSLIVYYLYWSNSVTDLLVCTLFVIDAAPEVTLSGWKLPFVFAVFVRCSLIMLIHFLEAAPVYFLGTLGGYLLWWTSPSTPQQHALPCLILVHCKNWLVALTEDLTLVADKLKRQWFQGLVLETNCIWSSHWQSWGTSARSPQLYISKVAMETLMTADDSLTDVYLVVKISGIGVVSLLRKSDPAFWENLSQLPFKIPYAISLKYQSKSPQTTVSSACLQPR